MRAGKMLALADAKALVATGDSAPDPEIDPSELAAWTMVASILLNRDDVINVN